MLVKKRYARHTKAIPIFFFLLVLLVYPINGKVSADIQPDYIDAAGETMEITATGVVLSANSKIFIGRTYWDFGFDPAGHLRWYLYNVEGEIAFFKEADWHETDDAQDKGYINDPEIVIPHFPDQGMWKLSLVIKGPLFGIIERTMITYHFQVGESSFVDNIMAPWCVTYGGLPFIKLGEFSWALPGVFWLTSPAWGFAIFFIVLVLYTRSFRLAAGLIKESGKRFREAITKKS